MGISKGWSFSRSAAAFRITCSRLGGKGGMGRGRLRGAFEDIVRVVAGNADFPFRLGVVGLKVLVADGPVVQRAARHRAVGVNACGSLFPDNARPWRRS